MNLDGVFMSHDGENLPVVRKSNLLVESICKATTNEKRVIIMGASKVQKNDPIGKTYSFHLSEIRKWSGIQNKRFYKDLEEAIVGVKRRDLWLKNEANGFELTSWFSWVKYDEDTKIVEFRFDESVHPYLVDLGSKFITYVVSNALALSKASYITIFELLKSYEYKGKGNNGKFYRNIELDYLCEILSLADTGYTRFQDIRRFIIEPAIKAINECTDINIYKIEYIKSGRSYKSIYFYCQSSEQVRMAIENPSVDDILELEPKILEPKPDERKTESKLIDQLITVGVSVSTSKKWLEKFGDSRINRNLGYSIAKQKEGKVKNSLIGYLAKAIEEDWGKGWEGVATKPMDANRKAETDEKRKEREADEKSKRERQERERIFTIFEDQPESMQDVILDLVELKNVDSPSLLAVLKADRAKGNIKLLQVKSASKFKEAMQENGLI